MSSSLLIFSIVAVSIFIFYRILYLCDVISENKRKDSFSFLWIVVNIFLVPFASDHGCGGEDIDG